MMPIFVKESPTGGFTAAAVKKGVDKLKADILEVPSTRGLQLHIRENIEELADTIIVQAEIMEEYEERAKSSMAMRHRLLCLLDLWVHFGSPGNLGSLLDQTNGVLKENGFPVEKHGPYGFDAKYEEGMSDSGKLQVLMDNISRMAYGRHTYGFDFAEAMNCVRYQTHDARGLEEKVRVLQGRINELELARDQAAELLRVSNATRSTGDAKAVQGVREQDTR